MSILLACFAIFYDVSVATPYVPNPYGIGGVASDRVVNLDALAQRDLLFQSGLVGMVIGCLFVALGQTLPILERIANSVRHLERKD